MNDFTKILLTQVAAFLIGIGIAAVLLRGFFWKFVKVKTSLGKNILVKLKEISHTTWAVGEIKEGWLIYHMKIDGKKEKCRLKVPKKEVVISRVWGVSCIEVEPETGIVIPPFLGGISGFDQVKFEDLYERALFKPTGADNLMKILLLLVVVALLASAASAFFGLQAADKLDALQASVNALADKIKSGAVVGGANL